MILIGNQTINSIHEQIGLPSVIHRPHKMPDEHDMIWTDGLAYKLHFGFGRGPIALLVVTRNARANQILPRIGSPPRLRNNVIDGERIICLATILAAMIVTSKNILSGKDDLLVGNADVDRKTNNARERHSCRYRSKKLPFVSLYKLCFSEPKKDDGLLDVAHAQRLVVMIEDEHFSAELAVGANCSNF